jgi:hypothetical protein
VAAAGRLPKAAGSAAAAAVLVRYAAEERFYQKRDFYQSLVAED